jgi:hypothetical protein
MKTCQKKKKDLDGGVCEKKEKEKEEEVGGNGPTLQRELFPKAL